MAQAFPDAFPDAFPEILALGEAMVEFNQSSKGEPNYLQGFGGDTSNFCIAASRQGARTGFVSAVGDDHFQHVGVGRPEGHANADFADATTDGVREHAVDANGGEDQS